MAKQVRRSKGRRRGAASRANNDLDAHLESLGLVGVEAYKHWCHERGFTAALNFAGAEEFAGRRGAALGTGRGVGWQCRGPRQIQRRSAALG